jgi:hypothetical protein
MPTSTGSPFHAQSPVRLLDTRSNSGAPLAAGSFRDITVAGAHGVPASGGSAVVVTLTAVGGTKGGYLTAYPSDVARPTASNVNYVQTTSRANLAIVRLTSSGKIRIYNGGTGTVHVVVDQAGYFTTH